MREILYQVTDWSCVSPSPMILALLILVPPQSTAVRRPADLDTDIENLGDVESTRSIKSDWSMQQDTHVERCNCQFIEKKV